MATKTPSDTAIADATPETIPPVAKRSFAARWGHRELFERGFIVTPPGAKRFFTARWGHRELFERGFIVTPTFFLQFYSRLKPYPLSMGEALFVIHMMEFKWDETEPFPGYKTLAQRMGVSDKMVRRHAQSLEAKGYLKRHARTGQTNLFDLMPLFNALLKMKNSVGTVPTSRPFRDLPSTDLF